MRALKADDLKTKRGRGEAERRPASGRRWRTKRRRVFDDFAGEGAESQGGVLKRAECGVAPGGSDNEGGQPALGSGLPRRDALNGRDGWEVWLPRQSQAHL